MRIGIPAETKTAERRVAATPDTVARLSKLGFVVAVQRGAGAQAGFSDETFEEAGATLVDDAFTESQVVLKVEPPSLEEAGRIPPESTLISMLWPAQNEALVEALRQGQVSAIALDKVPRITRAQKMDVLSSMANIAGYRAVIEAAALLPRFFGGQITAAGKTPPARVLVIGAGVAGLAAIGAARALGAEVYAFDTRAAVKEQVESMGGRFLELSFEEDGEGGGGYAKVMSKEFIEAEMALFREYAPKLDIVITTALIPGRPAPLLWKREHVELMPSGGVVVDLAAIQGGNCELTKPDVVVQHQGVSIIGYTNLTSRLPGHASQFFARNAVHLLDELGGAEDWNIDLDNDVIRPALVVHKGEILPPPPRAEPSPPPKAKPSSAPAAPVAAASTAIAKRPAAGGSHAAPVEAWSAGTVAAVGLACAVGLGLAGQFAPAAFLQHLTVFVLAVFIGWQVVWSVTASLHTPLMSVTNAISGIIIVGGMLQVGGGDAGCGVGARPGGDLLCIHQHLRRLPGDPADAADVQEVGRGKRAHGRLPGGGGPLHSLARRSVPPRDGAPRQHVRHARHGHCGRRHPCSTVASRCSAWHGSGLRSWLVGSSGRSRPVASR